MRVQFPIGDWSHDGHGWVEWYTIEYNETAGDLNEALKQAHEKHPDLDPRDFFCHYEDWNLPVNVAEKWQELGYEMHEDLLQENYVKFIVWYLNEGNPDLNVQLVKETPRWYPHGGFGYGLFSS